MTEKEIKNNISQGENEFVEFKSSFNKEVIETLVAFANAKGGRIFIGVNNDGKVIGVSINNESVQNWINEIKSKTNPSVIPYSDVIKINGKTIIIFSIPEFPIKPISVSGRYFVRRSNSNHQLLPSEISDLYLQNMQISWDSYPNHNVKINDLDFNKISGFINEVNKARRFNLSNDPISSLEKLGYIKENNITNASVILFSKELISYKIRIGRFKSPTYIISDKLISGTLFEVLEESMQTIISHLKFAFEITEKSTQRNEIPEYPINAIRELLLNCIVHRDYKSPVDIQIKIFDQSITFFNPGKLFGNITIDDLKGNNYQSRARNKLIAEAFYLTGYIEKYGSGFQRIRKEISEYKTMIFDFEEIGDGFLTTLKYKIQKTTTNDFTNDFTNENSRFEQVLSIIKANNKITSSELANILKVTKRTILTDISILKEKNILRRIGNNKTGHWEVVQQNPAIGK